METPRVYSYLRFSDPRQASGHSAERQIKYAARWAEDKNLVLDTSLTLRDEGLSAFHQHHVKTGALGAFLKAVDDGLIPSGSFLIVEGLDRLSRAEPIQAQAQLAQIINAGITVVTASDGKEYNREKLKANPMDLVYSLLVMIRAHEESDTKSKRVTAAIRRQCEGWIAGTYKGIIRNGTNPAWLTIKDGKFEPIEGRVNAMRHLIDLYLQGYAPAKALQKAVEDGISPELIPTAAGTLIRGLQRRDLIGIREFEVDNEVFKLEGYYPPIISKETFDAVQVELHKRTLKRNITRGTIPGIITGMEICVCGYCGGPLTAQNLLNRKNRVDGTLQQGHRRLQCSGNHRTVSCPVKGSCSSAPIEKAIFTYCSDQMNLSSLTKGRVNHHKEQAELALVEIDIVEKQRQLEKITELLLISDDDAIPLTFMRKAKQLELEVETLKTKKISLESTIRHLSKKTDVPAKEWGDLIDGILNCDKESRMKARKLVNDTFEKIVIYHHGISPPHDNKQPIECVLISKTGNSRLLRISRHFGKLLDAEDFLK